MCEIMCITVCMSEYECDIARGVCMYAITTGVCVRQPECMYVWDNMGVCMLMQV